MQATREQGEERGQVRCFTEWNRSREPDRILRYEWLRKMESTQQRIQRAEEEKDWAGLSDILDEARPEDVEQVKQLKPLG
jgi:hypothetical protein